jgi:CRISPR/Cas system-associated exonuclease Cas4 (RecB family)
LNKGIKAIMETRNPKQWLEGAIDNYLETKPVEQRIGSHFHPSSAGKCPRSIQLTMAGVLRSEHEARILRIFDTGHDMHAKYGRYFDSMGILLSKEEDVLYERDGVVIKGNCDYVIKDDTNRPHILELKSINSRGFNELWVKGEPVVNHKLQWNVYSGCLRIPLGEILYENKDDQNMKVFSVGFDEAQFEDTFSIFKMIHDYTQKDLLVPIPQKCNDKYCPAKNICSKERATK